MLAKRQGSTLAMTSTASSEMSTVTGKALASTSDTPLSIWGIAESLLSEYYPSSTITQIASLSWPATVIIDGQTYSVHPGSSKVLLTSSEASSATKSVAMPISKSSLEVTAATTTTYVSKSLLAEKTGAPTPDPQNQTSVDSSSGLNSDGKVAIVIGVVFGAIALTIIGIIALCLRRRKRRTGSYFKGRSTPSTIRREVEPWRLPDDPAVTMASYAPSHGYPTDTAYHGALDGHQRLPPPPVAVHPAISRNLSCQVAGERDPFITPQERAGYGMRSEPLSSDIIGFAGASIPNEDDGIHRKPVPTAAPSNTTAATLKNDYQDQGIMNGNFVARELKTQYENNTRSELRREDRPPTPLLHMMMRSGSVYQPYHHSNPFFSEEDEEAEDLVSPVIPAKSPERRHSPLVHYPSWDEVSEFDFTGERSGRSGIGQRKL